MAEILTMDHLVIGYTHPLCSPLNLKIPATARVGIIGTNGSGKSTLIKTLAGLIPPLSGSYQWASPTRFGYVPQENQINSQIPMTVMDLLKMGRHSLLPRMRESTSDFETEAHRVLEEMEIKHLGTKLVSKLSRGQRQRSLVARALIGNPDVLLLDEPYSALDDSFKTKLGDIFEARKEATGFSYLIIEHDLNRIINQVDWVILLGPHEVICGLKDDVINPKTLSQAYGSKVQFYEENGEKHIHFL